MGKKLLIALLLVVLVGSIFLMNYIVLSSQKEEETITTATEQKTDAQQTSEEASNEEAISEDTGYQKITYEELFDNSKLHEFKIVISREEWEGLSEDLMDMKAVDDYMRTTNYRKADLYYSNGSEEVLVSEVGFRTKGNTSRVFPEDEAGLHRFNFKIKFNETFDLTEGSAAYEYRDKREFADMAELNFKANTGADSTNIRELFSYNLVGEFGVTASKASMAKLTVVIDGVEHDYGVVKYIEPVDKKFLTKRFSKSDNDGNLYKCLWQNYGPATLMPLSRQAAVGIKDSSKNYRPTYDRKTNKADADYQDIKDFITNLNTLEGDGFKNYIDAHFSVDRFLRAQALDVLLGNIDGYRSMGNNYYLYFNEEGRIEWIPYDFDNILGAGWDGDPNWSQEGIATADIYEWNNLNARMFDSNATHPLFDKIIAIDEYRQKYEEYLAELIDPSNDYFNYDSFLKMYNVLYTLYGAEVDNEAKEGNVWEPGDAEWYFTTKTQSVREQLKLK